jgi:ADP-ribose pyrophosphatase YjhB (NUDIX family)
VSRKPLPQAKTAVRALIYSSRGEILLIRDTADEGSPDKWLIPGEWLEGGARPASEMRRLVRNRLHIDILVDQKPCDPVFDGDRRIEYLVFSAHPKMDMPVPKGDIWSAGWFTRDELWWNWERIDGETQLLLKAVGFMDPRWRGCRGEGKGATGNGQ